MKKQYIIPIFVPHLGCPNDCVFCNQKSISGQTKQVTKEDVKNIIEEHLKYIKKDSKVEVAFFGGSFTGIEEAKQEELLSAAYEYIKQKNLYEYGKDIVYNTERMSLNKNILNEKYYVVVSYYADTMELGDLDQEEIKERAFSELYTKSKSIIRALSSTGVTGRILTSIELADLLYVAYNRDESDNYGIDKARKAGFDELYSTAADYMDKKMQILDEEIERQAYQKANEKVIEAQSEKAKRYQEKKENMDDIIDNLADLYIRQNTAMLGKDVAQSAREKVRRGRKRKEKTEDVKEKQEDARRTSSGA